MRRGSYNDDIPLWRGDQRGHDDNNAYGPEI